MKKIWIVLKYCLNTPVYWISFLFPKMDNIWIFGSWYGQNYSDSSKYFYEYINNYKSGIRAIWLTKNKKVIEIIKRKGFEVYYTYSFKGYWYSLIAKYGFITSSTEDINMFVSKIKYINLWHGIPLKKIVFDDEINEKEGEYLNQFIFKYIFPFIKTEYKEDIIVASSKSEALTLSSAFQTKIENIKITGLPRNDVFHFENLEETILGNKIDGWKNENVDWLLDRLKEEVDELEKLIWKYEHNYTQTVSIMKECFDVANFAMMIADMVR